MVLYKPVSTTPLELGVSASIVSVTGGGELSIDPSLAMAELSKESNGELGGESL